MAARRLNREGMLPKRARRWMHTTVKSRGGPRVGRFCVRRRGRLPDRRRGHGHFGRGRLSLVAESRGVVSRSPNGAAFSGQTAVQLREIMAQKIFIVTGATGATGGYAVERLLEQGHAVRALAHSDDDRSKRLQEPGAEVV